LGKLDLECPENALNVYFEHPGVADEMDLVSYSETRRGIRFLGDEFPSWGKAG
jgi:hypothetical protein